MFACLLDKKSEMIKEIENYTMQIIYYSTLFYTWIYGGINRMILYIQPSLTVFHMLYNVGKIKLIAKVRHFSYVQIYYYSVRKSCSLFQQDITFLQLCKQH